MGNLRIKLKYKTFEIELEGEETTVQKEFKEIKQNGLGNILNGVEMEEQSYVIQDVPSESPMHATQAIGSSTSSGNYPNIRDVVMKQLPSSEAEWIIVYAFYATDYGAKPFTSKDLLSMYEVTKRTTSSRKANLSNNLKALFKKGYLSALNDDDMIITEDGVHNAEEIITRTHSTPIQQKKPSKTDNKKSSKSGNKKKSSTQTFSLDRNLNFRPDNKESLKDFAAKYKLKSAPEKILIITFYLQEILKMKNINGNHIYTGFEELHLRVPKSLYQLISDAKNKSGWLDFENMEDIKISIQGKNHIKFDIEKK